ncbi:MAG: hypothetical protein LUG98_05370, partial [Tannerellaceae bacterium]|nr:hypothetical protein [Tannerellaceae bacterium]
YNPMKNRKSICLLALAVISACLSGQSKEALPVYKDNRQPIEKRVEDLLSKMTLEEKVMQLNQYTLGRNDNANNMADPVSTISRPVKVYPDKR